MFVMTQVNPFFEARLINKIKKTSDYQQYLIEKPVLSSQEKEKLESYLAKIKKGYPLDYILGEVEFLGQIFEIGEGVLIPREETEEWVSELQKKLERENTKDQIIVDIGCGSGVIGLSLSHFFGQTILIDNSDKALEVVKKNTSKHPNKQTIQILKSDLLKKLKIESDKKYFVVANLPYVPADDQIKSRDFKVNYEPTEAIYSGTDGLDLFQELVNQIKNKSLEKQIAQVYFELDPRNIREAREVIERELNGFSYSIKSDASGLERVLIGIKQKTSL